MTTLNLFGFVKDGTFHPVSEVWTEDFAPELPKLPKYWRFTSSKMVDEIEAERMAFAALGKEVVGFNLILVKTNKNYKFNSIFAVSQKDGVKVENGTYKVRVDAVSSHLPSASMKEVYNAIEGFRNFYVFAATIFTAVSASGGPVTIPLNVSLETANKIAKIMAEDGCKAFVVDSTGEVVTDFPVGEQAAPEAEVVKITPDFFYVSPVLKSTANILAAMAEAPGFHHTSLLVSGPSGFGKTAFCKILAEKLGFQVAFVDMSLVLETEQLFGTRELKSGSTEFALSNFARACQQGKTIVVMDELNRTHPGALNSVFPLLDWRGESEVGTLKIKVAPGTIFVGTRNVGNAYVGTQASDNALTNRFALSVIVDSIPFDDEVNVLVNRVTVTKQDAQRIVRIAQAVRSESALDVVFSPRNTLEIAQMVSLGVPVREACQYNVVLKIEDVDTRATVETIVNKVSGIDFYSAMSQSKVKNIF